MTILGIDPGISGALCILDGQTPRFFDTPTLTTKSAKGKTVHSMDAAEIVNILMREVGRNANVMAILEKVSAAPISFGVRKVCPACGKLPQQGATSTFNFGCGFGIWQGILAGLQIPYTLVHPATWKRALLADMPKGKEASIVRAKQLYPMAAPCLKLKKHHGRSDALCLAHYGRMYLSSPSVRPAPEVEAPLFAEAVF